MSATTSPILISGAGMITCLGLDRETTWRAVQEGRCGMGTLSAMESALPSDATGGQAPDLPKDFEPGAPREVRYLKHAIAAALKDAALPPHAPLPYPASRCALMFGTTLHGMRSAGEFLRSGDHEPLRNFLASSTLRAATVGLGFEGFAATTCSACSSSLGSIALAVTLLQSGDFDLILAGGYDPISEYVYAGFNSLRLVAQGPVRPFARDRGGMKLAEGYGVVVLERAEDASRRGHKALAQILGCGESADAHHLTQPHPRGEGAARAVAAALESSRITPAEIDLIAAHATGTPDNDAGEFAALSSTFGQDLSRVPVVGFKSHLGHTLGGAGAVELILSAMALRDQVVPPCANVREQDVEFAGLTLATGHAKPARIRATLNTSLGFGGANTCIVLRAPTDPVPGGVSNETRVESRGSSPAKHSGSARGLKRTVFITGIGVVLPGAIGNEAFARHITDPSPRRVTQDAPSIDDGQIAHLLNAPRVRRMSGYVKLSLAATALAFQDAGVDADGGFGEDCSAVLGSTHGSANYSRDYYAQIVKEGIPSANPLLFAEGVPNAAAAHLSLAMSLKGACQTLIGSRTAGLDALRLAATRIAQGEWERAVVGAGEEYSDVVNDAYKHCGLYCGSDATEPFNRGSGFVTSGGAVSFILESQEAFNARGGRPRGALEFFAGAAPRPRREIDAAAQVLRELGSPQYIMSSANGTWIDRVEAAGIRAMNPSSAPEPVVSALYGHFAECFSVGPLASIAAVLLAGRLPILFGQGLSQKSDEVMMDRKLGSFGVLCTDYAALISGARISVMEGSAG